MLKFANHDIVFQEFPDEVTLAINLSRCPNACPGCHSAYLQQDIGEVLTFEALVGLIEPYAESITCVGFMGGDAAPDEVALLAAAVKQHYGGRLKTGWYSGRQTLPEAFNVQAFDYVKLGPYRAAAGPLKARTTNQRLYRVDLGGSLTDITARFWH